MRPWFHSNDVINKMVYTKMRSHHRFKILLRADAMTGYVGEFDAYTDKKLHGLERSCFCSYHKMDKK